MKKKTLLFFSLLLVVLSTGAQTTTTLWDASADNVDTAYPNVKSYTKNSDGSSTEDATTLDNPNKWFNTRGNEHYMLIKGDAFNDIVAEGATGYTITITVNYSNGNSLNLSSSTDLIDNIGTISTPDGEIKSDENRSITITSDQLETLKTNGLYLSGVYLNWKKITISPILPVTISNEVKEKFKNIGAENMRYSKEVGKKMPDSGYANIVYNEYGNLKYESCYIADGDSYSISAEALQDVMPGDTLHVLVENCAEHKYNETDKNGNYKYPDYKDPETQDGNSGAWAGLRVSEGWLAPKQNCFPIKGHFLKVLDFHMVDLIKSKGLRIEGCKFQLDYVVITKGEMSTTTSIDRTTTVLYGDKTDETGYNTKDGWVEPEPTKLSIPEAQKKNIKNGSSEITVTYSSSGYNKIQLIAGSGCYGAFHPTEGGDYTSISAGIDKTVSFSINSDEMASNIKNNQFHFATESKLTISKVTVTTEENRKRIEHEVTLTANDGKWEWDVKDFIEKSKEGNDNASIYWGDRIYVEYESAGNAPTATFEGDNSVDGIEIPGLRGGFINSNGKKDRYFIYLDFKDTHNLLNLANKTDGNRPTLKIEAPEGVTITSVSILPESRRRNDKPIEVNGNVDWTSSRVYANIGQVEVGDKITVHTSSNGSNPQFQASVMHTGEKNSKALAFNELFKFADIYDVLSYSSTDEYAREYIDGNPGTFTYTVQSQYMANQFSKFPFTIAGQDLTVTQIDVNSKAFVFDTQIGLKDKPVYWGTMCCSYNVEIPENSSTHAWIVTGVEDEMKDNIYPLILKEVNKIPAGTPVLISKDENVYGEKQDDFSFAVIDDKDKFKDVTITEHNLLVGELRGGTQLNNDNDFTYYKLTYKNSMSDNKGKDLTGFFKIVDDGILAVKNKAYLRIRNGKFNNAKAFVFKFENDDNETTGIDDIGIESIETPAAQKEKVYYNLNGQRIGKPTKSGIYICNGKKVIIK